MFTEAVEGMAEACEALGTPVVSGNVSLYNETNGKAILPTPVIGGVGVLEDVSRAVTIALRRAGETLRGCYHMVVLAEGGRTPLLNPADLYAMGYSHVAYPSFLMLRMVDTLVRALAELHQVAAGAAPVLGARVAEEARASLTAAVELTNSVAFVDTAKGEVAFRVKIKGENPEHAVFSPDGRFVYVSAEEDDKLDVIDVAGRKLVA